MNRKEVKKEINYLGQTFKTFSYATEAELPGKACTAIREEFYKKPPLMAVQQEMKEISLGSTKTNNIVQYFFKDLMNDCKIYSCKWSINEFMHNNDLVRHAYAKTRELPKIFTQNNTVDNIKTMLRIAHGGTAGNLSNYPLQSVSEVLKMYMPKNSNNYYDFSCGWGIRLMGGLVNQVNYFGTDPNHALTDKLNEMATLYKKTVPTKSTFSIKTHGSEIFEKDWENTMGLAFSSPPYFDLEDYKVGEQSIKDRSYDRWLEEYWRGTVKNIKRYLIAEGIMMLNIKSFQKYDLLGDMKKICIEEGLTYHYSIELKNINRPTTRKLGKDTNEEILIFTKGKELKLEKVIDEWL